MAYLGDFALESTFDTKFCTVQTTGAPFALAAGVISAYPDNSVTQLTAGITLSADFDGVTGLNNVRVVATAANGYLAGSNYQLVITTGTVNSVSVVGYVIAEFSIQARSALRPTTAARTLDVASTGEAGVDFDNILFTVAGSPGAGRAAFGIVDVGTVGAAATTTTTCDIRAAAAFTTSQLVGATIVFSTGEARSILTQTNDSITFDALVTAPTASTTTYVIFGSPPASTTTPMPVDVTKISGNTAAADNCQLMFDGTGYAGGTTLLTVDATKISASAAAADNVETAFASTIAELSAIPAANAPLWTAIKYLFLLARNKITQTSTTQLVKADDGTTTVATYTISDDATTYTRNEGA